MWASNKSCSVEGCPKKVVARQLCGMHYQRMKKNGDPLVTKRFLDPSEALSYYVKEVTNGCVEWTAAKDKDGYGKIKVARRSVRAHRFAWEQANGPIPEGMKVDHECWNHACVNVDHLRLANTGENNSYRSGCNPTSSTGARNVHRSGGRFRVVIVKRGEFFDFGSYGTVAEAAEVAAEKRAELFGAFAGRG